MKIMLILMIITSTSYYTMLLFKYLTLFSCFLSFAKEFKFNTEIKLWRFKKIFGELTKSMNLENLWLSILESYVVPPLFFRNPSFSLQVLLYVLKWSLCLIGFWISLCLSINLRKVLCRNISVFLLSITNHINKEI